MRLLVSGGSFDESGDCLLWVVDVERGTAETVLRHVPTDALRVPGKGFTGAAWTGTPGRAALLVCAFNAVYRIDPASWHITGVLHAPCMNDLHHVALIGGRLHVVNTGLDAVDVFSLDGDFAGTYGTAPAWVTSARQHGVSPSRSDHDALTRPGWHGSAPELRDSPPSGDYYLGRAAPDRPFHRRVVRDYIHPNHVVEVDGRLLVTRLADKSIVDIRTLAPVIQELPGHPHDGFLHGGWLWVTCIDGLVLAFEPTRDRLWREVERLDIVALTGHSGWCRGLLVTDRALIVGLTEIRQPCQYTWRDGRFATTETSILVLDRFTRALVQRILIRDGARQTKIYGVLPL